MCGVSIVLPTLNRAHFLHERFTSILSQTYTDWELIVNDSFSNDGSWQIIQEYAGKDERISAFQAPADGMYVNWNRCIEKARGKYIYIATSDDTMEPACLEKMAAAAEKHPECGIIQSDMWFVDENGSEIRNEWRHSRVHKFLGDWTKTRHIRKRPLDLFLGMTLGIVYRSMTQLLIRREIFDQVGFFPVEYQYAGDQLWALRASMMTDTMYLPERLSAFRRHSKQATNNQLVPPIRKFQLAMKILEDFRDEVDSIEPKMSEALKRHRLLERRQEIDAIRMQYLSDGLLGRARLIFSLFATAQFRTLYFMLCYKLRIHDDYYLLSSYMRSIFEKRFGEIGKFIVYLDA